MERKRLVVRKGPIGSLQMKLEAQKCQLTKGMKTKVEEQKHPNVVQMFQHQRKRRKALVETMKLDSSMSFLLKKEIMIQTVVEQTLRKMKKSHLEGCRVTQEVSGRVGKTMQRPLEQDLSLGIQPLVERRRLFQPLRPLTAIQKSTATKHEDHDQ